MYDTLFSFQRLFTPLCGDSSAHTYILFTFFTIIDAVFTL